MMIREKKPLALLSMNLKTPLLTQVYFEVGLALVIALLAFQISGVFTSQQKNLNGQDLEVKALEQLVITPKKITPSDFITINFPLNHPKNMSVRTPNGEWFVIHDKAEQLVILPNEEYAQVNSIRIKVSDIKGVKWEDGKRLIQQVFHESGEYLFYMADNLETEPDNTFYLTTTVHYRQ